MASLTIQTNEAEKNKDNKNKDKVNRLTPRWVFAKTIDPHIIYEFGRLIGQPGGNGEARVVKSRLSGGEYAMKVINKYPPRFGLGTANDDPSLEINAHDWLQEIRNEVRLQQSLRHPNICQFREFYEDEKYFYICLELLSGGELFDRIVALKRYSEKEAAFIFKQMVAAVGYLHQHQIAHCDIKPDNFVFCDSNSSQLKLIDFGMSKRHQSRPNKYFTKMQGTSYYMAPEVARGKYFEAADCWSLGVTLYVMLLGMPPFYADQSKYKGQTDSVIRKLVQRGFDPTVKAGYGPWFPESRPISALARSLISRLLETDPARRLTTLEILEHSWLCNSSTPSANSIPNSNPLTLLSPASISHAEHDHLPGVIHSLRSFEATSKLKQMALSAMTDYMTSDEIMDLKNSFHAMDKDNDGHITIKELQITLQESSLHHSEIQEIMKQVDFNNDGVLSWHELLAACVHRKLCVSEERLFRAFQRLDLNADGKLSKDEIAQGIKHGLGFGLVESSDSKRVSQIISECDLDGDGQVSYAEFAYLFQLTHPIRDVVDGEILKMLQGSDDDSLIPSLSPRLSQRNLSLPQSNSVNSNDTEI